MALRTSNSMGNDIANLTPALDAAAVSPHDSNALVGGATRGLYVGTAGDVAVIMAGSGNTVIFPNVPAGAILPICVTHVLSTGTGASDIVALW